MKPIVKLIYPTNYNNNFFEHLLSIAKVCHGHNYQNSFNKLMDSSVNSKVEQMRVLIDAVKAGHTSLLEHVSASFDITCSVACSHQLVRHRMASYTQKSLRYTKPNFDFEVPENLQGIKVVTDHLEKTFKLYQDLIEPSKYSLRKEEARYILPQMTETNIIMTANWRSLSNFFAERLCTKAHHEIYDLAYQMRTEIFNLIKKQSGGTNFLSFFEETKIFEPKCIQRGNCSEKNSCGYFVTN